MKKNYFFTALVIFILSIKVSVVAQAPGWQWAKSAGLTGDDRGSSIAVDSKGNTYATGWYTSASITLGTITLSNTGASDLFLVKYDASGNVSWARNQGGSAGDIGYSVTTDNFGNVYVTGWFSSPSIVFGTETLTNSGSGSSDIFIAKFDTSGNVLWAKSAGGTAADVAYGITTDAAGNAYITGGFSGASGNFGTYTLPNTASGFNDLFVAKYSSSGTVLWAKSAGGTASDEGYSLCADKNGNLFVTGYFNSPSLLLGGTTLYGYGGNDFFIVKYDATSGNSLLAKSSGGNYDEEGYSITEANGKLYVAGKFSSAGINFGTHSLSNASAGTSDVFIVKYDVLLNAGWAKSAGGADDDAAYDIVADEKNNLYATGRFVSASISFGTASLTNTSSGYANIWVVRYDTSGTASWAKTALGDYEDEGRSIVVDAAQNIYVSGKFNSSSLSFDGALVYKGCGDDFFIAKLGSTASIFENNLTDTGIKLYPNPNGGKFHIDWKDSERIQGFEIYNSLGEKIYESAYASEWIDISAYPKGIYFGRIFQETGQKEVKQNSSFVKIIVE